MGKVILICGKICGGKSYYANQLKQKEHAVILSCDEVTSILFDNDLGERHDEIAKKIWQYLLKKSVEIIKAGTNVILDWGFWSAKDRQYIKEYYQAQNIKCAWHYIDIDEKSWHQNIEERNKRVKEGNGGDDFYFDEGLMKKMLAKWETPQKNEIDVWYSLKR